MMRYGVLLGAALAASTATKSKFETKLTAHIGKDGGVAVELNLTNNTRRDVCFDYMDEATMKAADGSILGNPHFVDIVKTNKVTVVGANGGSTTEWPDVNSDGKGLSPADLAKLKQVTFHFEAYDCLQMFELHNAAPILYKRDLTAPPTFE